MAGAQGCCEGKIAGLYDLERTLGKGHFAVVKLARHVFTGQRVAVKVIDKSKLAGDAAGQLLQEVRCMKLVQHPNVVRLYEVIDTHAKLYLILELGDGGDMFDHIMRHEGGLAEARAKHYFAQIVHAISYCHKLHVVHRDLKPENVVFFQEQGVVKLTDFGFSNRFQPGKMLTTSCGSLAYSAPEILLGDEPEEERVRLLRGTGIPEAVEKDLANIHLEYSSIVLPFMESHPAIFDPKLHTLELYKQLVAFVMAYSFQEPLEEEDEDEKGPNPPMMVPVADILNHVANHNANLEYSPQCLRMVTTRPVSKGQEIFNTYGQMANWQLLHMYGFAEPYPGNTNDTADIQMVTVRNAALQRAKSEAQQQLVAEQWDFLCQLEMVGDEGAFVLGWDEVLTEEELSTTLKVLCMSEEEFKEYKEHNGWEEDSEEEENSTLSNEALSRLKPPCKNLLYDSVLLTLESYGSDLAAEQDLLNNKEAYEKLSRREQQALHVRYGQKRILHQLLELVQ
nr:PREDICTED: N-lysine methyltransferase SETD6 [Opisthocomus hoazin]